MLIKVTCPCGSRFSFDVEPENGRMPGAIACPDCSADATELANDEISRHLVPGRPPVPRASTFAVPVLAPPTPPSKPVPPPKEVPNPDLLFKTTRKAPEAHGEEEEEEEPAAAGRKRGRKKKLDFIGGPNSQEAQLVHRGLGVGGAIFGAIAGGVIWYMAYRKLESDLFLLKLAPAILAGLFARWLGGERSPRIGIHAILSSALVMFVCSYAITFDDLTGGHTDMMTYDEKMTQAKQAAELKGDTQIIAWLSQRHRMEWERLYPGTPYREKGFTLGHAKTFREQELPGYIAFVDGKPTKEEYIKEWEKSRARITFAERSRAALISMVAGGVLGAVFLIVCLWAAYWTGSS